MVARWYGTFTDGDGIRRRVALAWLMAKNWCEKKSSPQRVVRAGPPTDIWRFEETQQFGGRDFFRSFVLS